MTEEKNITVKIIDKNKLDVKMNVQLFGVTRCSQCGSSYELIGNEITCINCGNVDFIYGETND